MKYLKIYNEELKSSTYKSAADKLKQMGHIKRPEELMNWHEVTRKREDDTKKLQALNDCKQMGIYQLSLSYRKGGESFSYKGDFYINLCYYNDHLYDQHPEWQEGGGGLWIDFGFGVIPVDEEGQKFCSEVVEHIIGLGGDKLTYWLGSFWLNISRGIDPDKEQLTFKPMGQGYFEEYEGSWGLSNRASAMKFKDTLYKIFKGDIIIKETPERPNGIKEQIIDDLCNEKEHSIEEYEDIMNSIKNINLNKLYKE